MPLSHRERVIKALSHKEPDRVPFDLGSTVDSSIHIEASRKASKSDISYTKWTSVSRNGQDMLSAQTE